jgi:ribulose-phosphate 3-epimerase
MLAADFTRLGEQIGLVERGGADLLHLDVMDGHFVPNLSFGVPVCEAIGRSTELFIDTHLMIAEPVRYAAAFAKAGADNITFHIEVTPDPREALREIRKLGIRVGVALNPDTPVEAISAIIDEVDLVLVMTVWPGFGGQKFIDKCLAKVETLARRLRPEQWLEIDGGINADTIARAAAAGIDTFVAGTAVFGEPDPPAAIARLRQIATAARR